MALENLIKLPEVEISQELENGWGILAGAGVELEVKEQWAIFLEGLYSLRKTEGIPTINCMNFGMNKGTFPVDLNSWQVRLGIPYFY